MSTTTKRDTDWEEYNQVRVAGNYPKWPNEVMVKLAFGGYLKHPVNPQPDWRVLDVGCGFGNNLLPFLDRGCKCHGTEVTTAMAEQTGQILAARGFAAEIKTGKNDDLPYEDGTFDLLLSIGVLHYAGSEEEVGRSMAEYGRVLKPGGRALLLTVAPEHEIIRRARVVAPHVYEIQNYDFRDGSCFTCFDTLQYWENFLNGHFVDVEVGRATERLMQSDLDFFVAACAARG